MGGRKQAVVVGFRNVEELADRIGIIHHGRLVALGTLEELRKEHEQRGSRLEDIFLSMVEEK